MNKHNIKFNYNPCQRFGFRKLSVGLVAVTLSTIFFLTTTQTAHADEIPTSEVSETKDSFKNVTAKNKDGEDVDRYQITYNGNGNFNIKVLGQ